MFGLRSVSSLKLAVFVYHGAYHLILGTTFPIFPALMCLYSALYSRSFIFDLLIGGPWFAVMLQDQLNKAECASSPNSAPPLVAWLCSVYYLQPNTHTPQKKENLHRTSSKARHCSWIQTHTESHKYKTDCHNSAFVKRLSPEQFQPVGVWQSLREDGKARSCSTGKVARNETMVILSQPPAVPLHWRSRRGSLSGACAATDRPISHRRGGKETQTRTDNSNPVRFSGAPRDRRQTIFRAKPCAPCSSAP